MGSSGGSGGSSGSAAGGGSIASIGLQYYANTLKADADTFRAEGEANAATFQAQRLDVAAKYGELKASQTGAQMTRNLNTTLGNIDAIRAAAHTDPTSPTGVAVRENTAAIGNEQRNITVDNIKTQTDQQVSDAAYYRTASANALLSGKMAHDADMTKAYADAFSSLNKIGMPGGG
jgi:hypothetical protein